MDLCRSISVVELGDTLIFNALGNDEFDDIVTRNTGDLADSKIPAILPENLLEKTKG